jgi:hypothetical protein
MVPDTFEKGVRDHFTIRRPLGRNARKSRAVRRGTTVQFPTYLVTRPETPALAGFVRRVRLAPVVGPRASPRPARWGCSPALRPPGTRAGLLLPGFLLLSCEPDRLFVARPVVRLAALTAGVVAFVGGYLLLTGCPVADILFNLDASSALTTRRRRALRGGAVHARRRGSSLASCFCGFTGN